MANRFFAFGCSFTKHNWPTWAHCSAELYRRMGIVDHTYNFAVGGASNKVIAHTVMLARAVHNIDSEDIVYIMWSTMDRTDSWACNKHSDIYVRGAEFVHEGWHPQGSIFHSGLSDVTIDQTFSPQGSHTDTLQYKRLVRDAIPHAVYCGYHGDHEAGILDVYSDETCEKPTWGHELLREYYEHNVNRDNAPNLGVGDVKITSDRNPAHERFLLTDTFIDSHPHPQTHFDYAVVMYNRLLTGTDVEHFKQVVKSVGDDVAQYTRDLNKLHTDAYNSVHAAFDQEANLYPPADQLYAHPQDLGKAHVEFVQNPIHTSKWYADMEQCNADSGLNYNMVWDNTVNERGMHRNTYGDLWYAPTFSSQDLVKCEQLYGISYDALHDELYTEWCDALFPAQCD